MSEWPLRYGRELPGDNVSDSVDKVEDWEDPFLQHLSVLDINSDGEALTAHQGEGHCPDWKLGAASDGWVDIFGVLSKALDAPEHVHTPAPGRQ